jgi:hypothetical protein
MALALLSERLIEESYGESKAKMYRTRQKRVKRLYQCHVELESN